MINNSAEQNFGEWLEKPREDELSAKIIIKEGGAPSTACFLSQQIAEKCIKGILSAHGKAFAKIHDLLGLETLLFEVEPEIEKVHQELVLLNRYYTTTRYPGDYPQFSLEECSKAYEAALRVKDFVNDCLRKFY